MSIKYVIIMFSADYAGPRAYYSNVIAIQDSIEAQNQNTFIYIDFTAPLKRRKS